MAVVYNNILFQHVSKVKVRYMAVMSNLAYLIHVVVLFILYMNSLS